MGSERLNHPKEVTQQQAGAWWAMRHGGQRAPPAQSPMPTGLKLKLVYRNTFRKLIFLLLCGCLLFAAELTAKGPNT